MIQSERLGNAPHATADDDRELDLPVDALGNLRIDPNLSPGPITALGNFAKTSGRTGNSIPASRTWSR